MNLSPYHSVVARITTLLTNEGCNFKTFEHAAVRTSEEAAALRPEYTLAQGAKALVVGVKYAGGGERTFVQIVVPGNAKFDVKKVKAALGAKDIRFATEAEVADITGGVLPGGVPPFGNLFGLNVVADATLFLNEEIIFNAGDRRFSVAMRGDDYRRLVNPTVRDVASRSAL